MISEPALLADHIDRQSEAILAHWRETVESNGRTPDSESLSRAEFYDHVPAILDHLAERLRGQPGDAESEGRAHGGHRWRQGYDIAEIVNELGLLRASLFEATGRFAQAQRWDIAQYETAVTAINDVLDEVCAQSVRQFQEDSAQETLKALSEVKARQAAAEEAWLVAYAERANLRAILHSLPVAVWVLDDDGTFVVANAEAERMQGFEGIGKDQTLNIFRDGRGFQIFHPDGTPCEPGELPGARALRGETVSLQEFLWQGTEIRRPVTANASPLRDHSGKVTGAVVIAIDISDQKRMEADLERQKLLAEEASRHKTRLINALSHDVRTPLNAVVLAAHLLEVHHLSVADAETEVQQCLQTIRHSVKNMLDLLGDLLDLSKIDAGALSPDVSRFPLEPVLAECVGSIEPQARQKGLDLSLEFGPLAGLSIESDRPKLKQVIANLLSNALRYTEQGRIRIVGELSGGQVRISVEDTGVGISPADQARIYDEYAVLDNPQRKAGEGTGLGLAICRRLAILLHGEITLTSEPGKGSRFTLILPDTTERFTDEGSGGQTPASKANLVGAILVAEDHPDSRQTLGRVLKRMGYRVLEASNGEEALTLVRDEPRLQAVLMDVNMPGVDGIEATLALRADPRLKRVPIFALTGDVTLENHRRIAEAGVTGFLEKPVTWEALQEALDSADGAAGSDGDGLPRRS